MNSRQEAPRPDPASIAVFESKIDHVSKEMGIAMMRASRSPIFSQSHDFSCFVADRLGRLISQADGVPIHTGGGGFAVRAAMQYWGDDIGPEDVIVLNDPYVAGGNHLPDVTVIKPVFSGEVLIGFACNRAHQVDIGGGVAGTYNPTATEIFHEGVRIPPAKLYERGRLRRDLLDMIVLNTRVPEVVRADILSMVGATRMGARRMLEICADLGDAGYAAHTDAILEYAERIVRREIEAIPDGIYRGEDEMAGEGAQAASTRIAVTVTVKGSDVHVDFTGSSPQVRSYKNSSLANTYSAVYVALSTMLGPAIPHNEGSYSMITIHAPEGSVVNPRAPAPVTFSTVHPTYEIIHAIWRAFAAIVPEKVSAGWGKLCHPVTSGRRDGSGELYVLYHMAAQPGAGAYAGRDGFDQVGQLQSLGAITIPNLEIYEQLYPIEFVKHEFRVDTAGPGRHRGGAGVEYSVRMTTATQNNLRGEGLVGPTGFGVNGGGYGAKGALHAVDASGREIALPECGVAELPPCVITVESSGGGGWGDPWTRPPEEVVRDVLDGLLTPDAARTQYGVVIDPARQALDSAATQRLRSRATQG